MSNKTYHRLTAAVTILCVVTLIVASAPLLLAAADLI